MGAQYKTTASEVFDLPSLKDCELNFVMELAVHHLAGLNSGDGALIRFWGNILVLLDDERRRRCSEIAELNRLYFQ